ncbi:MAG: tetratricopeptide repeat protein, partial [Planctomycetes bacterium]|nr:tetratricopeptide repeat protein [Planctomycetota bacterium]
IQIKPDFAAALNNKGLLLDAMGNHKEAIETYDKALKIKPDFDAVWFNKSCAYALLSNKEDALIALKKAVELNPRYKSIARDNPDFSNLKGNADFEKIINK